MNIAGKWMALEKYYINQSNRFKKKKNLMIF